MTASESATLSFNAATEQVAEIKGFLCGFICSGAESEGKLWLENLQALLQKPHMDSPPSRDMLIEWYKQTSFALQTESLDLTKVLTAQELPLLERAQVLRQWCQGFINGISPAGLSLNAKLQGEGEFSREALISSFTRMDKFVGMEEALAVGTEEEDILVQIMKYLQFTISHIYRLLNRVEARH